MPPLLHFSEFLYAARWFLQKIHPDTPPEDFLHMFTFSNTPQIQRNSQHLPKPSFSGSIRNLPGLYITTKPIGKNHQTTGFETSTVPRLHGTEIKVWIGKAMDFWRIFFDKSKQRWLDWLCWKNEWKLLVTFFFFCNVFFCFRFPIANGFCNYWFETVLKILSVPKTSFLLWKSAIPKRNSSPIHPFLGAMWVLRCLRFS